MNPLHGALAGMGGSALFQLVMIDDFRRARGFWPWQDKDAHVTIPSYFFSIGIKLVAAGCVGGVFAHIGQVNGIWAAGLIGIASDQVVKTAGFNMIKEAKNEAN